MGFTRQILPNTMLILGFTPVKSYSRYANTMLRCSSNRFLCREQTAPCYRTCPGLRVSMEQQEKARLQSPLLFVPSDVSTASSSQSGSMPTSRRSGNYPPNIWNYDFLESMVTTDQNHANVDEVEKILEEDIRKLMRGVQTDQLALLTLIDDIQKLGIACRFEEDISEALERLYVSRQGNEDDGLHATALRFRLLRQHGFSVSVDEEFRKFKDTEGQFMTSLCNDVHGMLSLYEASYYAFEGEFLLDKANAFARSHLVNVKDKVEDRGLEDQITRALELPLHHRSPIHEARHALGTYVGNASLHELAKLNFSKAQSMYQKELQELIRWWRKLDLPNKLGFTRDRMVENFNFAVVMAPDPRFSDCRIAMAKIIAITCVIDDIYDVYGSLEELKLFTLAMERWDVNAIDELPEYMRLSFLALFNTSNEMAYEILKETGFDCLPYIKNGWCDLCKAYLVEARWYFSNEVPTFKDYLENAWISISGITLLRVAYFYSRTKYTSDSLGHLKNVHEVIRYSSIVFRIMDDWGTEEREQERGDVAKSIKCYVHETGASIEDARKQMQSVIEVNWKRFNNVAYNDASPFPKAFLELIANFPRSAALMYGRGDGLGTHDDKIIGDLMEIIFQPLN